MKNNIQEFSCQRLAWNIQPYVGSYSNLEVWNFNSDFWIEKCKFLFSIQISELKSQYLYFQFRFLNWNLKICIFNSDFWIEISTFKFSIQIFKLKFQVFIFSIQVSTLIVYALILKFWAAYISQAWYLGRWNGEVFGASWPQKWLPYFH